MAQPRWLLLLAVVVFVIFQKANKTPEPQPPSQDSWHEGSAPTSKGSALGATSSKRMAFAGRGDFAETAMADSSPADSASSSSLFDLLTPAAHAQNNAMLVRNGHISAYVDSLSNSKQKVAELLKSHTAHIENENQSDEYSSTVLRLTIKVPAEKFQTLFDGIVKISEKIRSHSVNVDDVLKQYTDIQSRLQNKKELQNRLRALVQKAVKISDILEIERELARVSEDIDASVKIMKQYENDARMSTINLDFSEPKSQTSGPEPLGLIKKIGLALHSGWEMVIESLLEFISWWPLWLLCTAGYFWYRRRK